MPWESTLTKEQQPFLQQLLQLLMGSGIPGGKSAIDYYMGILSGSPESFSKFEAPIKRQFQEEVIPGIAERFTGVGGQRSSAFKQSLGQAGAGLEEQLAAMRGNMQSGAASGLMSALMGLGQQGLGQYQAYRPSSPGFFQSLFGGLGGAAGTGLGLGAGMGGFSGLMGLLGKLGQKQVNPQ